MQWIVKFTLPDTTPLYINREHIVSVSPLVPPTSKEPQKGATAIMTADGQQHQVVEDLDTVMRIIGVAHY